MESHLHELPDDLQRDHAAATPAARLRTIRQRLAGTHAEPGSTRLVIVVSAVEALARSLVVHASGRPASTADMRHRQLRDTGPAELVEEVLRLRGAERAARHFGAEPWALFELAVRYRDLVVHECAALGAERHAPLIAATDTVFKGLIELAGLDGRPRVIG
ncbi:MAG: hypothetical protein EOO24_26870 [Comamonadaceae bacterium]|nr:MAG: hypothetical protein EOO24_26870 [Comamonadaceae bacterium]